MFAFTVGVSTLVVVVVVLVVVVVVSTLVLVLPSTHLGTTACTDSSPRS